MTAPQPGNLPGPEQPPGHPGPGQHSAHTRSASGRVVPTRRLRPRGEPGPHRRAAAPPVTRRAGDPVRGPWPGQPTGRSTTRRFGSSPSDSLRTPRRPPIAVVHHLALERGHGVQPHGARRWSCTSAARLLAQLGEFATPARRARYSPLTKHDPGAGPGLPVHRKAGQFLQRLQDLTMRVPMSSCRVAPTNGHQGRIRPRHPCQCRHQGSGLFRRRPAGPRRSRRQSRFPARDLPGPPQRGPPRRLRWCILSSSAASSTAMSRSSAPGACADDPGTHRLAAPARQRLACSITAGDGARILRLAHHRGSSSFRVLTCCTTTRMGRALALLHPSRWSACWRDCRTGCCLTILVSGWGSARVLWFAL